MRVCAPVCVGVGLCVMTDVKKKRADSFEQDTKEEQLKVSTGMGEASRGRR